MGKILTKEKSDYLICTNEVISEAYKHIKLLANCKYKRAIKTLQTRHKSYNVEDFIQDTMQIILKEFTRKKFPSINHLKSFINKSMSFHYLKEKRKYFYTKQRGSIEERSIYEPITDYATLGDTISYDNSKSIDLLSLSDLLKRNLYVVYDWSTAKVCTLQELKQYNEGYILSVNHFIQKQREDSIINVCKYFKQQGFYMTRTIFNDISQEIVNYIKRNNILLVESDEKFNFSNKNDEKKLEQLSILSRTCTCGFVNKEESLLNDYWQCPSCGKVHDKLKLIQQHFNTIDSKE